MDGLVEWAKTILVGKSGSAREFYTCHMTRREFHEQYLQSLPKVMELIAFANTNTVEPADNVKNKFNRNLATFSAWKVNKRVPLTLTGRSYEKFLDVITSRLRVSFNPHPKLCKHCATHAKKRSGYTKAVEALSLDVQNPRLREVVAEKERELQVSRLQKQK